MYWNTRKWFCVLRKQQSFCKAIIGVHVGSLADNVITLEHSHLVQRNPDKLKSSIDSPNVRRPWESESNGIFT